MMEDKLEWFYSPDEQSVTVKNITGPMVADVFGDDEEEIDSNGILIEAAPKMLRLLKELNRRVRDLHALFNLPIDDELVDIENFLKTMEAK